MAIRDVSSQDRSTFAIGVAACAAGAYFGLVGVGLVPDPSRINGPLWLGSLVGLAIFCAGLAIVVRALAGMGDSAGEMPPDAPRWMKAVYWLCGVIAMASLASIGTWVAFGSGERAFSMSGLIDGSIGAGIGRAIFGICSIMTWAMVIAFMCVGARKIFAKS
ncbi:MAG: hypothetical protein WCG00_01280 [Hyphomicrobiales bacterium]